MRDHGGNLDWAVAEFGGALADWIDLSTGINPAPYPIGDIPAEAWAVLPRKSTMAHLCDIAADCYGTTAAIAPLSGATGAIQAVPYLRTRGTARVIGPTYNEHAAALRSAGWTVEMVADLNALAGADLAIVVNPNNPDGRCYAPQDLLALAEHVGMLIVDESFGDVRPDLTLSHNINIEAQSIIIERSFGKFYGLAGVRLGFAISGQSIVERLRDMAGPWPVSGPAIEVACRALADRDWQAETIARLNADCARLDALATARGWVPVGGEGLFRTYDTPDATAAQNHLATHKIWTRIFPYSDGWIRLGLPHGAAQWDRVTVAFA